MPRNIIDVTDLTVEEIDQLISTAEDILANPAKYQDACAHKQLATLFFEPSTRTRLSFESAMLALGAGMIGPNLAQRIVEVFLSTDFEGGRHARRVGQIMEIEAQ